MRQPIPPTSASPRSHVAVADLRVLRASEDGSAPERMAKAVQNEAGEKLASDQNQVTGYQSSLVAQRHEREGHDYRICKPACGLERPERKVAVCCPDFPHKLNVPCPERYVSPVERLKLAARRKVE